MKNLEDNFQPEFGGRYTTRRVIYKNERTNDDPRPTKIIKFVEINDRQEDETNFERPIENNLVNIEQENEKRRKFRDFIFYGIAGGVGILTSLAITYPDFRGIYDDNITSKDFFCFFALPVSSAFAIYSAVSFFECQEPYT